MNKLLLFSALGLVVSPSVLACCGVGRGPVSFYGQTNIVVWDAERKIEHFVRRAKFAAAGADLGFIAPTPSVPTLSEADDEVFTTVYQLTRAISRSEPGKATAAKDAPASTGDVDVISTQRVGKYDATIVAAKDAAKLETWLKEHHYNVPSDVRDWLDVYVKKGWVFTAFKVANAGIRASTGTIRMTFSIDRPFNPYFVPKSNQVLAHTSPLKLYVLGNGRAKGTVSDSGPWREPDREGQVYDTNRPTISKQLHLKLEDLPPNLHITAFVDPYFATKQEGDLFFTFEPDAPSPWLYAAIGTFLVVAGAGVALRGRRIQLSATSATAG